jgi:two-component system chemotaxis response regulator CheY
VHCLIVDDSAAMRLIVVRELRRSGFDFLFLEADDGVAALELYEQYRPQLIIADRNMPAMNGVEFVRSIRQIEQLEGGYVPVVMVTTEAGGDRVQEAHMVGIDAYLTKPFAAEDLAGKVSEVLPCYRAPGEEPPLGEDPLAGFDLDHV